MINHQVWRVELPLMTFVFDPINMLMCLMRLFHQNIIQWGWNEKSCGYLSDCVAENHGFNLQNLWGNSKTSCCVNNFILVPDMLYTQWNTLCACRPQSSQAAAQRSSPRHVFSRGSWAKRQWTVWQSSVYMLKCEKYPTYGSYDTMLPSSPHSHPPCVMLWAITHERGNIILN